MVNYESPVRLSSTSAVPNRCRRAPSTTMRWGIRLLLGNVQLSSSFLEASRPVEETQDLQDKQVGFPTFLVWSVEVSVMSSSSSKVIGGCVAVATTVACGIAAAMVYSRRRRGTKCKTGKIYEKNQKLFRPISTRKFAETSKPITLWLESSLCERQLVMI